MGDIIAVIPRTKPKLAIFEPTTFPKAKSGWPDKAAWTLTINSGAEVAKETTVIPITILGIEKLNDNPTDARINQSPPLINKKIPIAIAINDIKKIWVKDSIYTLNKN